ncbi:MAG: hypothetical protein VX185_04325 [Pseudomonadota bacterium]|nr:hypothetical protein [Pseudomonadota bacterium]
MVRYFSFEAQIQSHSFQHRPLPALPIPPDSLLHQVQHQIPSYQYGAAEGIKLKKMTDSILNAQNLLTSIRQVPYIKYESSWQNKLSLAKNAFNEARTGLSQEQRQEYRVNQLTQQLASAGEKIANRSQLPSGTQNVASLVALLQEKVVDHSAMAQHYAELVALSIMQNHSDHQNIQLNNIKNDIDNQILTQQFLCFAKGETWDEMKSEQVHDEIYHQLMNNNPYVRENHLVTLNMLRSAINDSFGMVFNHLEGGRFKAHKKISGAKLEASLIRADSGKIYALLHNLTRQQQKEILEKYGVNKSFHGVLGEGGFGKVRLALDTETGEIVAVKKYALKRPNVSPRQAAIEEVKQFNKIGGGRYLLGEVDFAHLRNDYVHTSDKGRKHEDDEKSYVFMPLAGDKNCLEIITDLDEISDPVERAATTESLSQQCIKAVAELNSKNLYHRDIKPENFSILNFLVKLIDYGFVTEDKTIDPGSFPPGTSGYFPPEVFNLQFEYSAEKHDSFALGMTLLMLKLRDEPANPVYRGHHLHLPVKMPPLQFDENNNCIGFLNTQMLRGHTLDEIIAKLLDASSEKRISAQEALQLPYFHSQQGS